MKKQNDWKPFIDIVNKCKKTNYIVQNFLKTVPKKYKLIYALALSVAKWHPSRKTQGGNKEYDCGLCCYDILYGASPCVNCVLSKNKMECNNVDSPFDDWHWNQTKENANKMFKVLYKLYREEYNKLKKKGLV